jgi:acylphosphatase
MMSEAELCGLHVLVEGHVQGVGYRYFVQEVAAGIHVTGWVRNRHDGSVEVLAEGKRDNLEKLLAALRKGPRAAYVSDLSFEWLMASNEFSDFRVRMTG